MSRVSLNSPGFSLVLLGNYQAMLGLHSNVSTEGCTLRLSINLSVTISAKKHSFIIFTSLLFTASILNSHLFNFLYFYEQQLLNIGDGRHIIFCFLLTVPPDLKNYFAQNFGLRTATRSTD
jgi:hypothetical protein